MHTAHRGIYQHSTSTTISFVGVLAVIPVDIGILVVCGAAHMLGDGQVVHGGHGRVWTRQESLESPTARMYALATRKSPVNASVVSEGSHKQIS